MASKSYTSNAHHQLVLAIEGAILIDLPHMRLVQIDVVIVMV